MKTKTIITAVVSILFATSLNATEITGKNGVEDSTVAPTEFVIKELTTLKKERQLEDKKIICEKNESNQILEKLVYLLDDSGEWVLFQKYQYCYNFADSKQPSSLLYMKWDKSNNQWSKIQTIKY